MNGIIYSFLALTSSTIFAQSRSLAVENEIIVETANGVQTTQFLELANQSSQNMSIITLLTLFAFISSPFLIYLITQKSHVDKKKKELHDNVILMSEFSSSSARKRQPQQQNHDDQDDLSDLQEDKAA